MDMSLIGMVVLTFFVIVAALSSCSTTASTPQHEHDYLLVKQAGECLMYCRICGKQEPVPDYYNNYYSTENTCNYD